VLGAALAVVVLSPPCARGQALPDYDFQWSTIGSPGNRAANAQEAPNFFLPPPLNPPGGRQVGAVNHDYRLSRTEVTTAQWFEFVQAYTPYYSGAVNDPAFTSLWINATDFEPGHDPGYQVSEGTENLAAPVSWRYAARYVNWLHNDKGTEQSAFETGAYDTSTFTQNLDGSFNDQLVHDPGAQFWLPTLDEWTKGMHYDPHRYGAGQEGYWLYPHGSDEPPIPGYPDQGGESLAGVPLGTGPILPVGSFPTVQSPWGLLDGSGGLTEWLEYTNPNGDRRTRGADGERDFNPDGDMSRLDRVTGGQAHFQLMGVRVASVVPSPSGLGPLTICCVVLVRRRPEAFCRIFRDRCSDSAGRSFPTEPLW